MFLQQPHTVSFDLQNLLALVAEDIEWIIPGEGRALPVDDQWGRGVERHTDIDPTATALDHARAFAATFNPGDVIDEKTGFTADNLLSLTAAAAPPTAEDAVIAQVGDLA